MDNINAGSVLVVWILPMDWRLKLHEGNIGFTFVKIVTKKSSLDKSSGAIIVAICQFVPIVSQPIW